MTALGITQTELGRRAGITGGTINHLIRGKTRSSTHLHRIARALNTTPAYLEGEIEDPAENAPLPPAVPLVQHLSLLVALPAEDALAHAFKRLLALSRNLSEDDLAQLLAKRLPLVLQLAGDALRGSGGLESDQSAAGDHSL